jgi:hypothetical protein
LYQTANGLAVQGNCSASSSGVVAVELIPAMMRTSYQVALRLVGKDAQIILANAFA